MAEFRRLSMNVEEAHRLAAANERAGARDADWVLCRDQGQ
ncbi:MAG: hypothetical protein JWP72_898 [Massilia sp.]|nr:hypothetical protein [Massilia sp.]